MRSGEDVKKKWTCMSSESKKKLALNKREQRKTGGGSLPSNVSITPMDERIEGIIGPTAITGVEGGIDVLDEATTSASSPKPTDAPSIMESADNDEQVTLMKGVGRKRKRVEIGFENSTCTLVEIEQHRLVIEKQRLRVEEDRLHEERKRLEIEEERLKLEKEKHKLYLCQMGIIPSVDISVQPESEQHLIQ
eukprot:XP_011445368.1 PREDICTED: golgin subfamily A member 6-like protein 9 [Crassostrea gigas]